MEFSEFASAFSSEVRRDQVEWLTLVGEEALQMALTHREFRNRTGNLISSIGYAVTQDGSVIEEGGFELTHHGHEGQAKGRKLVREVAPSRGVSLIFVAGEHYATYVEARGYDVNTAGELIIDQLMEQWAE